MEQTAETYWLRRIIAMLLSLAQLADKAACGRSCRVRRNTLRVLYGAEDFALGIVMRDAQDLGQPVPDLCAPDRRSDGINDAMRLAASFRALAFALHCIWDRAFRAPCRALRVTFPLVDFAGVRLAPYPILATPRGFSFRALDSPATLSVLRLIP